MYITPTLLGSLEKIRFMIAERQGLATILGDSGLGKSTVLRFLEAEYSAEGATTALIHQTEFPSPFSFLKTICSQFDIEAARSQVAQHAALEEWLVEQFKADKTVILFIDEAQRLTADLLEVVRALLNFETYDDKLLQIVLAGTLELRDRILAKRSKALKSRIFAPCMLNPFSVEDTVAMIEFRCRRAGVPNPFSDDVCRVIYSYSGGVPRDALRIAAHAWNLARKRKLNQVPVEIAEAAREAAALEAQAEASAASAA